MKVALHIGLSGKDILQHAFSFLCKITVRVSFLECHVVIIFILIVLNCTIYTRDISVYVLNHYQ